MFLVLKRAVYGTVVQLSTEGTDNFRSGYFIFFLLIGLSQRRISLKREGETTLFGTDRTFTFIGILGYLLYILDPTDMRLFMGGGAVLGLLLGLNYYVKQSQFHVFGVTTIIIALITYCLAPIVSTQPSWFYVMVIVTVLFIDRA